MFGQGTHSASGCTKCDRTATHFTQYWKNLKWNSEQPPWKLLRWNDYAAMIFNSLFSCWVVSDSLRPHGLRHKVTKPLGPLKKSWQGKRKQKTTYYGLLWLGFPDGSGGKESTCNIGNLGSIPGWGKWREWQHTLVFLPGEFPGQRSLVGYSPWGHKESDTTEWLILPLSWVAIHLQ